jgi:hypothetical protein
MRTTRAGYGYTSLRENHLWKSGVGAGHNDKIPESWRISRERIDLI